MTTAAAAVQSCSGVSDAVAADDSAARTWPLTGAVASIGLRMSGGASR